MEVGVTVLTLVEDGIPRKEEQNGVQRRVNEKETHAEGTKLAYIQPALAQDLYLMPVAFRTVLLQSICEG